jgi:hypothetical protein
MCVQACPTLAPFPSNADKSPNAGVTQITVVIRVLALSPRLKVGLPFGVQ